MSDNTADYLDFVGTNLFPWVEVTFAPADVDSNGAIPRNTQLEKAYAATKARNDNEDLNGFDGFVVITLPGLPGTLPNPMAGQPGQSATNPYAFDGGAGGLQDKPACAFLDITGTPLNVRVVGEGVAEGHVDLEISTTRARSVEIVVRGQDDVIASRETRPMGTPCGDEILWGTWIMQSSISFRPYTTGLGGEGAPGVITPLISWRVGGVTVPAGSGLLNVPATDGLFTVDYAVDPVTFELSLSSRGGEKYSVPVIAIATEVGGANATTGSTTFDPLGYYIDFRRGDLAKLDDCMGKYLVSVRLEPRDLLIPPGPDPYRQLRRDRINQSASSP